MSLYDRLKNYVEKSVGITLFIVALILSRDRFLGLYRTDRVAFALAIVAALEAVADYWLFWWVVVRELDLLNDTFDQSTGAPAEGASLAIGLLQAAAFAVLIATATNVLFYAVSMLLLQLFVHAGTGSVNSNVAYMYRRRTNTRKHSGREASDAVFRYYLERPLLLPIAVRIFATAISLSLATVWFVKGSRSFQYFAYAILLIMWPLSELPYYIWRRERDLEMSRR